MNELFHQLDNVVSPDIKSKINDISSSINGTGFGNFINQLNALKKNYELEEQLNQAILLADEIGALGYSEFFEEYQERIEQCEFLGNNGWVISGHCTPIGLDEWITKLRKTEKQQ